MNLTIDHNDMSLDATGILGETLVPTVDANGARIRAWTPFAGSKKILSMGNEASNIVTSFAHC